VNSVPRVLMAALSFMSGLILLVMLVAPVGYVRGDIQAGPHFEAPGRKHRTGHARARAALPDHSLGGY
jgi:hypothetical protein